MTAGSNKINIGANTFQNIGYESITVTDTAQRLTLATLTDSDGHQAKKAVITIETAQVRYRYDGIAPTSSEGHLLNPFSVIVILGSINIRNFRIIRVGSTNATIRCSYEL